ncbi:unnamed protein product [Penicillium egyptiacum]|uniref:AMP-dependent synthetase/ligase domain-containing protein n=1 Tax=Penicillium egyptiacum TaxID=1303716 RepID=A0A9W4P6G6_9EURO|nr:unnamed protein product [Penicillium egyptiacum]
MKELSQACGEDLLCEPQSIIMKIRKLVGQHPNELAIACPHQPADLYGCKSLPMEASVDQSAPPHLRWSYQTLDQTVNKIKQRFMAYGSVKTTLLFVFCENQVESVIFTLVAYSLGWIHVPIGPEYLCNLEEVQRMITSVMASLEASNAVFLANNEDTAQKLDQLDVSGEDLKVCCGRCSYPWITFDSLMEYSDPPPELQRVGVASNELSVFFTSGTTSLPKACLIEPMLWFHGLELSLTLGSLELGNLVGVAPPINHAFGFICTMMPLLRGASIVLVGPRFSPQGMIRALIHEKCTHAALVATMLFGLEQMIEDESFETPYLKSLIFAGMTMRPSLVQRCKQVLGASTIENFYGMTEGVFVSTGPLEDLSTTVLEDVVTTGRPISGGQVRVCVVGGRSPVPTGITGVLHFSGPSLINRYLNCESPDFYESDGNSWFVTGDRAVMDDNKQLYVVGREKDIIVCGGEKIVPSKIEDFLAQTSQFQALEPHVVAGEDIVAGEVPIVVIRFAAGHDVENQMRDTIRENLGARYVPRAFITLKSLGLRQMPRTPAGKIQKEELKRHVTEFRRSQSFDSISVLNPFQRLTQSVLTVWSRLLGIQASHLDIKAPISQLADSVLMLSARARIRSETGRSVPLSQWLTIRTIEDQMKTLDALEGEQRLNDLEGTFKGLNPRSLGVNDIVHLGEDENAFNMTKEVIEKNITAQGLSWEDVQNVFPCTDFIQILCRSKVINTWNIRTAILSKKASAEVKCSLLISILLAIAYKECRI